MPVATPSNWCIRVNEYLRELVTEHATHNIGLCRHRRGLYKQRSSLFDWHGVYIDPSHMHVYFNRIHYAFINAIRHHYDHVHLCAILRSDKFCDLDTQRVLADLLLHQNEDHDICLRPIPGTFYRHRDRDQNQDFFLKNKTKIKTMLSVLKVPRDQDAVWILTNA